MRRECDNRSTEPLSQHVVRSHVAVPRVVRRDLPDGYFHVMSRGVPERAIFVDDDDRRAFLVLLQLCAERYEWTMHALCLMTTHYHLVLESTRVDLSRGLQRLNGRYAQAYNVRHSRFGHLFAGRFVARAIESERYVRHACQYVLENPVRAGICPSIDDWPWSHSRYEAERHEPYGRGLRATYQPTSMS